MLEITLGHYLTVAAILFTLGIFVIFLNRKNVIVIMMSIELMLLAVNINLVAFSAHMGDMVGQVFTIFVLLGAEFLAMILVIVYVGAVAVLFLFVVMMLDINFVEMRQGFLQYLPIGGLIGVILLIELLFIFASWTVAPDAANVAAAPMSALGEVSNTRALGLLLYTKYIYFFQASGLVLLVAMIGAIVLTLRTRKGVRRQKVPDQLRRTRAESVEIKKVETGKGI